MRRFYGQGGAPIVVRPIDLFSTKDTTQVRQYIRSMSVASTGLWSNIAYEHVQCRVAESLVDEQYLRDKAYAYYEARGGPDAVAGSDLDDWYRIVEEKCGNIVGFYVTKDNEMGLRELLAFFIRPYWENRCVETRMVNDMVLNAKSAHRHLCVRGALAHRIGELLLSAKFSVHAFLSCE